MFIADCMLLSHCCSIAHLVLAKKARRYSPSRTSNTADYEHLHVGIGTAQCEKSIGLIAGATARDMLAVIQAKGMGEPCSSAGTVEHCRCQDEVMAGFCTWHWHASGKRVAPGWMQAML